MLRVAFETMPARLDPRFAVDAYASRVASLVHVSLVRSGGDGGYVPFLADSWHCRQALRCSFRLRKDLTFHDGRPITASDVKATYEAVLDPSLGSPRRGMLASIDTIETPDAHTVDFTLKQRDAAFMEAATLAILPADQAAEKEIEPMALTGSGPYRITSLHAGERIILEAYPGYASQSPQIPQIELRSVPDGTMRALELVAGEVDLVQNAIDPDTTAWLERCASHLVVSRSASSNFQYLGMNLAHPVLSDIRVRRAIAYAIDREAIVENLLVSQAATATGLLPPDHWAYSERVRDYPYDPERSRRLLDEAGLFDPDGDGPEPRMTLSYKTTTVELRRRIAEAIASQLEAVGIHLEILSYEWGTFFEDIRTGNFQLYSLQWVGIVEPDLYRQVFHSGMTPPRGNNRGRYRDEQMDTLTERGARATARGRRKRIYGRVQRRAAKTLPYIPLWWPQRIVIAADHLKGFKPHPAGDLHGLAAASLVTAHSD